jgi:hypothetical protein
MLEEDLIQLREEASESLMQSVQMVNERITELEAKMGKLELQAIRTTLQQDAGVKVLLNEGPLNPEK